MDFGVTPPEINSLRMYTGPGAGPMMVAAAAWNNLAAGLGMTALSSQSVISELTDTAWLGSASAAMTRATAPYLSWMHTTTNLLQQAAAQAMASAAAFETAFAMTVPPPVIAANRSLQAGLIATNILGQNTPAISATEAQYAEMWAQDAAAMYGYAASSTAAAKLSPLTSPAPTTSAAGLAGQAAALSGASTDNAQSGLQQLVSSLPSAMQSLASPAAAPSAAAGPLDTLLGNNVVQALGNGVSDTAAWNMMEGITTANLFNATTASQPPASTDALGAGLGRGVLAGTATPGAVGGAGETPVSAGLGEASTVGKLSVPQGWSASTPAAPAAAAPLAGSGWTAPAEESAGATNVAAGMPAYASAGRGGFGAAPRYGFKPTVMPRHLVV